MATSEELERLRVELFGLEESLDRIDYRRLRRHLGSIRAGYINIRHTEEWDLPPANFQMGLKGVSSLKAMVNDLDESRLIESLLANSEAIRKHISKETLPSIDVPIIDDDELIESMINSAAEPDSDRPEISGLRDVNEYELARILVVELEESMPWASRPKLNEQQGQRRVELAGIITNLLAGGLLTGANAGLGLFTPALFTVPAIVGVVPTLVGLAVSCYTGLAKVGDSLKDLGKFLREPT